MAKVTAIPRQGSYQPPTMLSNLTEMQDDIKFLTTGIVWEDGRMTVGWTYGKDALGDVMLLSAIQVDAVMKYLRGDYE